MIASYWNLIISVITGLVFWVTGSFFFTAIGMGFTVYIFIKLLQEMGERIPIIELMTALAALQWVLGPVIEYNREIEHYRYRMHVDEIEYMSFIVPSILAFWIGANIFKPKIKLEELKGQIKMILDEHPYYPYILLIAGTVLPFMSGFLPASLNFVFFLLSTLKYIGLIYLIHSKHRFKWHIFILVLALTAASSISTGMFHDLVLWIMMLFTFLAKELKLPMYFKFISAVLGVLFAMTIQAAKYEYRVQTWQQGYSGNKTLLFFSIAAREWRTGDVFMPKSDVHMNVRFNQGWIISAVMANVPENEAYAKGATIREAIINSFIPRVINPDKKIAGGRENFRKFTGLGLMDNTSMGISIAGEGYANFGWFGGIIFMFIWGLFISLFWRQLEKWSGFFPTLLIWSPMLFLQVVKAETEFGVVLNYLIKASIVVLGLVWIIRTVWGESFMMKLSGYETFSDVSGSGEISIDGIQNEHENR